jgi:hypothetical protein
MCLPMLQAIAPLLHLPMWAITLVFAAVFGGRNAYVYPFNLPDETPVACDPSSAVLGSFAHVLVTVVSLLCSKTL